MFKSKKILSIALAGVLTVGTLFSYAPIDASAKRRVRRVIPRRKIVTKKLISSTQMSDYKAAVTAVVVLEGGLIKYDLRKPENLAYSKNKAIIARASVQRILRGSSKDRLLARISIAELMIYNAEMASYQIPAVVVNNIESLEAFQNAIVDEGSKYELPKTIRARMNDMSIRNLEITWDKVVDINKTGEVLLTGKIKGSYKTANLKVIVKKVGSSITKTDALEVVRVEQEERYLDRISIRFSQSMNLSDYKDGGARRVRNYTLEDNKGKEWDIDRIVQDGNNEKDFIIYTKRDLDEDRRYTLTVQNVEDRNQNVIKKVSKDFRIEERTKSKSKHKDSSIDSDDITATLNNAGERDQSIIIDFDTRMTTGSDSYSITDLDKYSLIAYDSNGRTRRDFFNDGTRSSINVEDLYRRSIDSIKGGKAVEISLPYDRDRKKDDSYDLGRVPVLKVEIERVEDTNENAVSGTIEVNDKGSSRRNKWIGFSQNPEAISVDELHWIWNDKVNLDMDDIRVVAANNVSDAEALANRDLTNRLDSDGTSSYVRGAKLLKIENESRNDISRNYTEVTIRLQKQGDNSKKYENDGYHVLTYDGKFIDDGIKKSVYMVVVPSQRREDIPATQNSDDTPVRAGAFEVSDSVGPRIVDNSKRAIDYRYKGYNEDATKEYGSIDSKDAAVEVWQEGEKAVIVLTFEENISATTLSNSTFKLSNKNTDFGDAVVDRVFTNGNRVILELSNVKSGVSPLTIVEGAKINQNNLFEDEHSNKVSGLEFSVGKLSRLTKENAKKLGANIKDTIDSRIEALRIATESVTKAEGSKKQLDIDAAQVLVNNLATGLSRDSLQNKLDNLKILIAFTATGVGEYNASSGNRVKVTVSNTAYVTGVSVNGVELKPSEYILDITNNTFDFSANANDAIKIKTIVGEIPVKVIQISVMLTQDSKGKAGNIKITGLEPGKIYIVEVDKEKRGVKADGTLGAENEAAPLNGMEITGLDNTKSYKVVEGVIPVVKLLDGSLGTAGYKKITGLKEQKTYVVECGTEKYGVKSDGTIGLEAQAAPLTGTEIIGLYNTNAYKVSQKVAVSRTDVWQENENAVIVLTFDENINKDTVSNLTFMLSNKNFGDSKIDKIVAKDNKIIFQLSNIKFDSQIITIKKGDEIIQRQAFKTSNNSEINRLKITLGEINKLTKEQANDFLPKP